MQGTGTQADPYIVDNYPDFVTAAETDQAYVEFAPNTKIDMNSVSPLGVGQLTLKCRSIDGKGSEITNLICSDNNFIYFDRSGKLCDISHLELTNFKCERTLIYCNSGSLTFKECIFSGISLGQSSSYTVIEADASSSSNASLVFTADNLGCALTIDAPDMSFCNGYVSHCPSFYNCNLKINCNALVYSPNISNSIYLENSYLSGNINYCNQIQGKNSVINTISNSVTVYSPLSVQHKHILVNSDKAESVDQYFDSVTSEQMRDAEYLQSIGFPIGA